VPACIAVPVASSAIYSHLMACGCCELSVYADMSDFMKQDMERFSRQQPAAAAAKQAEQQVCHPGSLSSPSVLRFASDHLLTSSTAAHQ
jgi:hypothetical protein